MFNVSQLCERSATLHMIECTRFSVSLLLQLLSPTSGHLHTAEWTRSEAGRRKHESRGSRGGSEHGENAVPTREAHNASAPSLQLRALIRLIVSNIETHNKHNTWRPFAILISPLNWPGQLSQSPLGYHSSGCKIMTQSSPWLRSYYIP